MTRQLCLTLGVALALVWSATALAAESKVLFILDGSGSMQAKINGQSKIDMARTVMGTLLKSLPAEVQVGLETYGHSRKNDCRDIEILAPVGRDHTAVLKAMQTIQPKGMTPLTEAMRLAAAQFREYEGDAQVVVVSDGEETCGGDPCAAVREALAGGVRMKVHVVGLDVTPKEAEQLKCIAQAGNGKYFKAANAEELGKVFAQVKQEVAPPAPAKSPPAPAKLPQKQALFEDKFDRDELGELYEVLEPDSNRLILDSGTLLIVATEPQKNLVLLQKTFSGDFVVTIPMTMQVTKNNRAGLYYWIDRQNGLFVGVYGGWNQVIAGNHAPTFRGLIFSKKVSGQDNTIQVNTLQLGTRQLKGEAQAPELWYIQLERKGVNYTGRLSVDGSQWTTIGTHTLLPKGGRLGFGANSGEKGLENAAQFGAFVVQGAE